MTKQPRLGIKGFGIRTRLGVLSAALYLVLGACLTPAMAVDGTWKGGSDTSWQTIGNWTGEQGGGTDAVITFAPINPGNNVADLGNNSGQSRWAGTLYFTPSNTAGFTIRFRATDGSALYLYPSVSSGSAYIKVHEDVGGNIVLGSSGAGTLRLNDPLIIEQSNTTVNLTINRPIVDNTGVNSVTIHGPGTTIFSSSNTYAGGTILYSGQLNIDHGGSDSTNSAIGAGPFTISGGAIDNTSGGAITLLTTNAHIWNGDFMYVGSADNLNIGTGNVTLGQATTVVTVSNNTFTVGGIIADGASTNGITKMGTGILTLTGANTYGGDTTVSNGTLAVTGSGTLGDGSTVNISSGAKINLGGGVDATVSLLFLNGATQNIGTWGSESSAADNRSDTYFEGTGIMTVNGKGVSVANTAPTSIQHIGATFQATLTATPTNADVYVHYGTTDKTTNYTWDTSAYVGAWTNVEGTSISFTTNGLTAGQEYYYTFRATNAATNVWASPSTNFTALSTPVVDNNTGGTNTSATTATLRGELTDGSRATAWICWGTSDGGTASTASWDTVTSIGAVMQDVAFSSDVSGLDTNFTYWYRCYATNTAGTAWSGVAASFNGSPADNILGATFIFY